MGMEVPGLGIGKNLYEQLAETVKKIAVHKPFINIGSKCE